MCLNLANNLPYDLLFHLSQVCPDVLGVCKEQINRLTLVIEIVNDTDTTPFAMPGR